MTPDDEDRHQTLIVVNDGHRAHVLSEVQWRAAVKAMDLEKERMMDEIKGTIGAAQRMDTRREADRAIYTMSSGRFAKVDDFAVVLYTAYGESSGWVNFQGNPMPSWHELPEAIRKHWGAVAIAACRALV